MRWGLLLVLSANMLIDAIEVSVVIVAMPSIAADLHGPAHWPLTAFALGFGATVAFAARVVERMGRRRGFLAALMVFAIASAVSAAVDHMALLAVARAIKGACVALMAPTGLAIIAATFPEGPRRTKAISVYSFAGASGFTVGLLLSGVLTELSWRWTLLFPAPVALLLLIAAIKFVPADEPEAGKHNNPLRPFREWVRARSAIGAATLNGSFWGLLVIATLHLSETWSPPQVGAAMLPASVLLGFAAPIAGRLIKRFGTATLIAIGAALPPIGYALYPITENATYLSVTPTMVLTGAGFALGFSALHLQAITGVPAEDRQAVSGVYQAAVQLGGAGAVVTVAVLDEPLTFVIALGLVGLAVALTGLKKVPQTT